MSDDEILKKLKQEGVDRTETPNSNVIARLKKKEIYMPNPTPIRTTGSALDLLNQSKGNQLSVSNPELTFSCVNSIIKRVNKSDKEYKGAIRYKQGSVPYRLASNAVHAITRAPRKTIYQVFEDQLLNVGDLTAVLGLMTEKSKPAVEELKKEIVNLTYRIEKEHQAIKSLEEMSPKIAEQHNYLRGIVEGLNRTDPDYYSKFRELFESSGVVDETKKDLRQSEKNVIYNMGELKRLMFVYAIMESALSTTEEITRTASNMQKSLWTTKKAYPVIEALTGVSEAVSQSLQEVSKYNGQLNADFATGIRGIRNILDSNQGMYLLNQSNSELGLLARDIQSIEYRNDLLLEERFGNSG